MIKEKESENKLSIEELATFCKSKGFVFKSSEIYGGFAGFWDFGPLGIELFNNIKKDFWNFQNQLILNLLSSLFFLLSPVFPQSPFSFSQLLQDLFQDKQ